MRLCKNVMSNPVQPHLPLGAAVRADDRECPPVDMKAGRGLRLIRSLVADLGGSVEWSFTSDGNFALVHLGPVNRITDEID
jgi:hypothetical protein